MKLVNGGRRYALLLAVRDSEYVKKVYGGYFNVFLAAFGEEGESWDMFRVVEGEFPKMSQLHRYDGFVVSGSPSDAYGSEIWVLMLCSLLQTLNAMNKKVLGICFGHQLLCRALGGKVGRARNGWDLGVRRISFIGEKSEQLGRNKGLSIVECHQDEILELPPGAQVVAASDRTEVEMFAMGTNILGFQGHPEYTVGILSDIIDRLVIGNSIPSEFGKVVKIGLVNAEPDTKALQRLCRDFLKGRQLFV